MKQLTLHVTNKRCHDKETFMHLTCQENKLFWHPTDAIKRKHLYLRQCHKNKIFLSYVNQKNCVCLSKSVEFLQIAEFTCLLADRYIKPFFILQWGNFLKFSNFQIILLTIGSTCCKYGVMCWKSQFLCFQCGENGPQNIFNLSLVSDHAPKTAEFMSLLTYSWSFNIHFWEAK